MDEAKSEMLYSASRRFGFIHIQKNAGISISKVIADHVDDAQRIVSRHARVCDVVPAIGTEEWKSLYTFAVVRNPWDRLVSWYSMIAQRSSRYDPFFWKKPRIWRYAVKNSHDFKSFIKNCDAVVMDQGVEKSFAFDQLSYIEDAEGKIGVTFVARFENITDDLSHVWETLNIDMSEAPRLNASKRPKDYRLHYDEETAEIVAHRFKRDIDAFGYEFDDAARY
ncbi:MAG: sulfotransferase family 2 domain-containing protein [Hyphomicrobiaceae bacterium]|nr:sulfotransferase family 2 domain-containing protein [Hyphomicrobiaceae bacterium]